MLSSGPPRPGSVGGAHLPDPQAVPPANALDPSFDLKYRVINYYWAYMFDHKLAALMYLPRKGIADLALFKSRMSISQILAQHSRLTSFPMPFSIAWFRVRTPPAHVYLSRLVG